jgi:hypothetical protein
MYVVCCKFFDSLIVENFAWSYNLSEGVIDEDLLMWS